MEKKTKMEDSTVLNHIKKLSDQEEHLYTKGNLTDAEVSELHKMKVELDRCWDYLRQRRALREFGKNPNDANVRDSQTVENYKQ